MTRGKSIKFSFIMPAFNVEKYIGKAIESVLAQTYDNWELVVVNDGSTDKTLDVIQNYSAVCSKIKVINQSNSGSGCGARAAGLAYLTGSFTQILDADDYVSPDMLEKYQKRILEDDSLDVLIPDVKCIDSDGKLWLEFYPPNRDYNLELGGTEGFYQSLNWKIHGWNCARTSIYRSVNYYSAKLVNDDEFAARKILHNAKKIGFVDSVYFYRYFPESASHKPNPIRKYDYMQTACNVFEYSVKKEMPRFIIDRAHSLYVSDFVSNTYALANDMCAFELEKEKIEYIREQMQKACNNISLSNIKRFYKCNVLRKIFYVYLYRKYKDDAVVLSKKLSKMELFLKNMKKKLGLKSDSGVIE